MSNLLVIGEKKRRKYFLNHVEIFSLFRAVNLQFVSLQRGKKRDTY
jgi:hypothetical protein